MSLRRRQARDLSRNVNYPNFYIMDSLPVNQMYYRNVIWKFNPRWIKIYLWLICCFEMYWYNHAYWNVAGTDTDIPTINELVLVRYEFNYIPQRSDLRGNGIGIFYVSGLLGIMSKSETSEICTHFENRDCTITIGTIMVK